MIKEIRIIILAVKYWVQGDKWAMAYSYAMALVKGFK